jgi:hypothetical protein
VEKNWLLLTKTTTKAMAVKYFKVKHKVLKISLHGQIWSDFEKISLKISGKAGIFLILWIKNATRQMPVISGKNQNHKSQFSDEFGLVAPPRAKTKKWLFEACLQEKSNHATSGIY